MSHRREFLKATGAAAIGASLAPREVGARPASAGSMDMLVKNPDHPRPASFDRLPLEWHKATVKRLQEKLGERGLDGIFIKDRWNIIYYTGLHHSTTERPFACFIPTREMAVYWFHPGLDRDLVDNWWKTDSEYYFDFQHTEGGFPNHGKVAAGPPVDLLEWMFKGIVRRGFAEKRIGLDQDVSAKTLKRMSDILPKAQFQDVGDLCLKMRMVKTPEEIALTQRAMNYWSQIHAFARDYILQHGTDATDFQVSQAAIGWGTDLVMKDIKRDGRPHTAVGIGVGVGCRGGVGTAYPHPNQFHHNKIRRGDALQVAGVVRIGGYGGEQYRAYQIAPSDAAREKMWEVTTESVLIQARESKAGVRCQDVAKAVHDYQVKNAMEKYIYHRPAHGEGMEGHQAPYIALGDQTMLEEGMMFSNEPGLYNPEGGYGYNHSDNVLVSRTKGIQMGSAPLTKEWCFLKL